MTKVTIHEAKTHLSRLIAMAREGEEVVISNRHRPVARLEAIHEPKPERQMGSLKGYLSDDVLEMLIGNPALDEEIAADFHAGSETTGQ